MLFTETVTTLRKPMIKNKMEKYCAIEFYNGLIVSNKRTASNNNKKPQSKNSKNLKEKLSQIPPFLFLYKKCRYFQWLFILYTYKYIYL